MWLNKRASKADRTSGVSDLNQVARFGLVEPGYPQDLGARRVLEFAYLPHDEVLLMASMDGQYPFWVSRTGVHDTQTNTAIANAALFDDFSAFTKAYPNLRKMTDDRYRRRFSLVGTTVTTPFDYGFSSERGQIKYWGQHIANGISQHYRLIKEMCHLRELDGRYLDFLKSYLAMLEVRTSDAVKDYEGMRTLIRLMEAEDYLYVSDDQAIYGTYVRIRHNIGELYNRYMAIVR